MTSKLTITREQLIKKAQEQIEFCRHTKITGEGRAHVNQCAALFEIALAAMDSEPVAWTDEEELRDVNVAGIGYLFGIDREANKFADPRRQIMLYRHAQQPTVAGDGRAEFETWMLKRWGRERRDDDFAMGKFIYGEDYADSYTRCVWKAWSASRAAMLQAGNSPVIPEGWTGNDKANAALMMLDRIETVDSVDDDRINGIKRIIHELAAAPQEVPDGK
ncbi:hypothetical protein ACUQO8_002191 [Klebsiella pneumoniae]